MVGADSRKVPLILRGERLLPECDDWQNGAEGVEAAMWICNVAISIHEFCVF